MKPILLSAVFAFALTAVSLNANAEVVNIGISTVGLYELPTEISKRKGFYQEEGLDARKIVVRTPLHVAALLAGRVGLFDRDGNHLERQRARNAAQDGDGMVRQTASHADRPSEY